MVALELLGACVIGIGAAALVNWAADRLPDPESTARPVLWRRQDDRFRPGRHAVVTLMCAIGMPLLAWTAGATATAAVLGVWSAAFLLVAVIDLEHRLVLNKVLLGMAAVALATSAARAPLAPVLWQSLAGGAVGLGIFVAVAVIGRGGMSAGDVKLAAVIGLIMGYPGVLHALIAGIVCGGVAALVVVLQGKGMRAYFAYAPWLSLGAMVVMLAQAL